MADAKTSEHFDNPIVMLFLLTLGVLAIRKAIIYIGAQTNTPSIVGFAS